MRKMNLSSTSTFDQLNIPEELVALFSVDNQITRKRTSAVIPSGVAVWITIPRRDVCSPIPICTISSGPNFHGHPTCPLHYNFQRGSHRQPRQIEADSINNSCTRLGVVAYRGARLWARRNSHPRLFNKSDAIEAAPYWLDSFSYELSFKCSSIYS